MLFHTLNDPLRLRLLLVACHALALVACGGGGDSQKDAASSTPNVDGAGAVLPDKGSSPTCEGDWTLGSTFYTCPECGLGQACEPAAHPKNCADGSFIMFPDGSCFCIAACSSFSNIKPGDVCDAAGKWHCRSIRATNSSANGGTMCVPDASNLCTEGG